MFDKPTGGCFPHFAIFGASGKDILPSLAGYLPPHFAKCHYCTHTWNPLYGNQSKLRNALQRFIKGNIFIKGRSPLRKTGKGGNFSQTGRGGGDRPISTSFILTAQPGKKTVKSRQISQTGGGGLPERGGWGQGVFLVSFNTFED